MALDPNEVNEDGIHIGFTTPPTTQPVTESRHTKKTTVPETEDEIRRRIEDAERRATAQESVGPDKEPAKTRQTKSPDQR